MRAETGIEGGGAGSGGSTRPVMQRARGTARVSFAQRDGKTCLDGLYQSGSAKIRLPKVYDGLPLAVLLNTSGGITGGDRLNYTGHLAAGTRAILTSQTAERAYRSSGGTGEVLNSLSAEDGAHLEWLPQELILFEASALSRKMDVRLEGSARFTGLEMVVLGRKAMGESVKTLSFRDQWRIWRNGRLTLPTISPSARTRRCWRAPPLLQAAAPLPPSSTADQTQKAALPARAAVLKKSLPKVAPCAVVSAPGTASLWPASSARTAEACAMA
ncbi:urease accessory protein UreD [Pannonibacter sp. Pt2-lr]